MYQIQPLIEGKEMCIVIDCMEMNDTDDKAFVGLQQQKEELLGLLVLLR